jgi:hypothetical protein
MDIMDKFSECTFPGMIDKEKVHICVSYLFIHPLDSFRLSKMIEASHIEKHYLWEISLQDLTLSIYMETGLSDSLGRSVNAVNFKPSLFARHLSYFPYKHFILY